MQSGIHWVSTYVYTLKNLRCRWKTVGEKRRRRTIQAQAQKKTGNTFELDMRLNTGWVGASIYDPKEFAAEDHVSSAQEVGVDNASNS